MFGSKTYQPCGRYPRIGTTACTKWFGPSIIPGPICASWETSQPYSSIDAGGNIFVRNEDTGISEKEGTTTITTPSGHDPSAGQHDCLWNETQQNAPGGGCRHPPVSTINNRINCGETLYHAGGVLRCRSASTLQGLVRENCDGRDTHHGSSCSRPTLRAYSAPLFLHAALFPPKHSTHTVRGNLPVTGSKTSSRNNFYSDEGRRARQTTAPCRHRQGGYLHRYKGFEQEKMSCPPVATFRVIGGLGEFPRRKGNSAQQPQESATLSARRGRASRADGACGSSEENPGSLGVELSHEVSTEEGRPSAYPLELFAEGSNVAPESPLDGGVTATPAPCCRSKGRPNGAKRLKAWGEGGEQRGRLRNRAEMSKIGMKDGLTVGSKTNGRENRRFGAAKTNSFPCSKRSSAFFPYSLERPVSPERTRAFLYTSI